MDEQRDEVTREQVTTKGVSRAVPILTFLVGLFLGAALVKPWDLVFRPTPTAVAQRPASSPASTPAPTATPSTSGPPAECAFAGGWRVFALGQPDPLGGDGSSVEVEPSDPPGPFSDIGNPLRRWLEIDPLERASGPDDRRIPFVTIVSDRIGGIGYCPPPDGRDGPPAGARFEAWVLDTAGMPTALPLRIVSLELARPVEVAVFIGSDRPVGRDGQWAPGRYVFAVEPPDAGTYSRWFGVEIRTPPGRQSN
jgi:hypothetical protein